MSNNNNSNDNPLLVQMTKDELIRDFEQVVRKVVNQMQVEQQTSKEEKQAYTRVETAELLDVSLTTLHNWNKKEILKPCAKIGRNVYYSKNDIQAKLKIN
ncbi:putative site-specific integrase-resolvase [Chryseobacterium rhizosphaerae]|uniref:helix-turn-helix domain-containing protein n=1 Tax=Chryseobacterium rhizosphaerae TaxID=395937 RepID=UPI00286574B0|nr:helix-turn-helix domain-containing protein [Chryseobacterium rhizosphaerae]MDR6546692.1 putative site-specific integrase-resolvase [Chryseobacterium rhizosphaerae]